MKKCSLILLAFVCCFIWSGCEREAEIPPVMEFKTGSTYTSQDAVVAKNEKIVVGVIVTKTEDDFKTYNVSVSYDGASSTNTVEQIELKGAERDALDKDVSFMVRNQTGTEKYFFTLTDVDGNIAQKELTFIVE